MNVRATIAEGQRLESGSPAAYDWSELEADVLAIEEARTIPAAAQAVLDELANLDVDLLSGEVASDDSGKVALEHGLEIGPELPEFYGLLGGPDDASGVSTAHPLIITANTLNLSTPYAPLENSKKRKTRKTRKARTRIQEVMRAKTWKRASAREKFHASIWMGQAEQGLAFNLNLSERRRCSLGGSEDAKRRASDWINRALKEAGVERPRYSFRIEVSPERGEHLHGVILLDGYDPKVLRRAMQKAGGKLPGTEASRQLRFKPVHDADGWNEYLRKAKRRTREQIWGEPTFISRSLLQSTEQAWKQFHG